MNSILHWLTSPEWALVVKALLHSLWQGAVVGAGIALLLRRIQRPETRYRLSLAGLALVMASVVITWAALNAPTSQLPTAIALQPQTTETLPTATGPVEKIVVAIQTTTSRSQMHWTAWLALCWLVGAGVMLGRASVKIAGAEQLRGSCRPLEDNRFDTLVSEAKRAVKLTRQIRVAVTDQLTSPAVVGVLVPTLILPLSLVTTLSPEQLRFILLHELAHIRRGDYLANLFQLFAEALLFFNPAIWWLSHQVRREREACCDALVIELGCTPAAYAGTLVNVAEAMLNPAPAAPAFGNGREPSSLADRIHRVLVPHHRPSLRLTWGAILTGLIFGAVAVTLLASVAREVIPPADSVDGFMDPSDLPTSRSDSSRADGPADSKPKATVLASTNQGIKLTYVAVTGGDAEELQRRIYLVDPNLFKFAHESAGPLDAINLSQRLRSFLASAGVDLTPPKNLFFSQGRGALLVTATAADLEVVEQAIQSLKAAPRPADFDWMFTAMPMDKPGLPGSLFASSPGPANEEGHADTSNAGASTTLVTRTFKITAIELALAVGEVGLVTATNTSENLKRFLMQARFDPHLPGRAIFFSPDGGLLARGTPDEIAIVERALVGKPSIASAGTVAEKAAGAGSESKLANVANTAPATNLLTRTYNLDLKSLVQSLEDAGQLKGTNLAANLRELFTTLGVEWDQSKNLYLNRSRGLLLVRATLADLDVIEQAIRVINAAPLQVNIRARFVELPVDGYNVFMGSLGLSSSNLVAGAQVAAHTNCVLGILSDPQARAVFKALASSADVEILSAPEVTTLSGHQAQIQMVDIHTVVTGAMPVVVNGVVTNLLQTTQLPFGPVLDITPYVMADGYTVQLSLIPTVTEFVGYDDSGGAANPLPRFRVRQLVTTARVWDGQTIVLGGFVSESVGRNSDGTENHQSRPDLDRKKQLLVFVTPTIIDQAGNLRNSDADAANQMKAAPNQQPVLPGPAR